VKVLDAGSDGTGVGHSHVRARDSIATLGVTPPQLPGHCDLALVGFATQQLRDRLMDKSHAMGAAA
jgi:hypothetical protein